ncbi:MAG: histidine kinase dimerization/phospho-acceptor domain-containing protein [Acidimicrobiales bacterium]
MSRFTTLRSRLLLSMLLLVSVVVATGLIAVRLLTPLLFDRGLHAGNVAGLQRGRGPVVSSEIEAAYDTALTQSVLIAGAVGLVTATMLALVFGRLLLRRLGPMQVAATRLASGDYDHCVDVPPEAELADLARSINTLGTSLAKTEESRARLMSDVAHELRNPLTTIEGYLEGLIDGVLTPDAETLGEIADEAHRMKRITEDLSFMSKAEEGAATYQMALLDLAELARKAAARIQQACEAKGLTLVVVADNAVPAHGDALRLAQVLDNLLQNGGPHATRRDGHGRSPSIHRRKRGRGGRHRRRSRSRPAADHLRAVRALP